MNDQNENNTTDNSAETISAEEVIQVQPKKVPATAMPTAVKILTASQKLQLVGNQHIKKNLPAFRVGDTLKVHVRIVEGNKERVQVFEGVVIKRSGKSSSAATFTVRKVSYNIGVERTFLVHSPRIEKIELVSKGIVRRARLFYLRPLRGKAARIKSRFMHKVADVVEAPATESEVA